MKRSPPPKRKTPLKAHKRVNPVSKLRERERIPRATVRLTVFERDGWRCLLAGRSDVPPCHGYLSPHELRKASQWRQGRLVVDNVVTLCWGHNCWVETARPKAWELGLVVNNGETIDQAWERMRAAGLAA